jgi:hypothetical protein
MKTDFQYKSSDLSEEHIKQRYRFLKIPYVKGESQKWHKFAAFKWWHKREMDKRFDDIKKSKIIDNDKS